MGTEPTSTELATQAVNDTTDAMIQLLNESSVGLYRIQEHTFKKTPQLLNERRELVTLYKTVDLAFSNLTEAQEIVSRMNREQGFSRCLDHLHTLQKKYT